MNSHLLDLSMIGRNEGRNEREMYFSYSYYRIRILNEYERLILFHGKPFYA